MKKNTKLILKVLFCTSILILPFSSQQVYAICTTNKNKNNINNPVNNPINNPVNNELDDPISEPVNFNEYDERVLLSNKLSFSSNEDIKKYFINLNEKNNIISYHGSAKVNVNVDSYQQKNQLSYTEPTSSIDFKYNRVGYINFNLPSQEIANTIYNFLLTKGFNLEQLFFDILNTSSTNSWSYNVSEWSATAKKRFMGTIVVVPMWAGKVNTTHAAKTYTSWDNPTFTKIRNFATPLITETLNLLSARDIYIILSKVFKTNVSETDANALKKLFIVFVNLLNKGFDKLSTNILPIAFVDGDEQSNNDIDREEQSNNDIDGDEQSNNDISKMEYIDFGNVKCIANYENKVKIKSNNFSPIVDYVEETHCLGATCSHNLRNLVDVIKSSFNDLVAKHFLNYKSFLWKSFIATIYPLVATIAYSVSYHNSAIGNVLKIIDVFTKILAKNNFFHRVLDFINNNKKEILINYTGELEKHGIQLGKCGNLVSGIEIKSSENIVTLETEEPYILYNELSQNNLYDKLVTEGNYNMNTLHCIVEMSNYQKLYDYILTSKLPSSVKWILYCNIKNTTLSSKEIYKQYVEYTENKTKPKMYKRKLDTFKTFISEGWKLPFSIKHWGLLANNIIPSYLSQEIFILNENSRDVLIDNFNIKPIAKNIEDEDKDYRILPKSAILESTKLESYE